MPSLHTAAGHRVKIKSVEGSWRVILPYSIVSVEAWLEVARIPHASYDEAFAAAQEWVSALDKKAAKTQEAA